MSICKRRGHKVAIRIYIDQGHNPSGFNTGAEGNGFYEQDITYEVGVRLYRYLSEDDRFAARLSRPTKSTILGKNNADSLRVRVDDANRWGADLYLSIHTNAAENPRASGSEALVFGPGADVAIGVGKNILENLHLVTGLRNRGIVYRPGLYVLKRTKMPAVLVEIGFITNPQDAELMAYSPDLFALGIYRGLKAYYG